MDLSKIKLKFHDNLALRAFPYLQGKALATSLVARDLRAGDRKA